MATIVINECDKCGKELRMDNGSAAREFGTWMAAEVRTPPVSDKGQQTYKKIWCERCWEQISQPSARVVERAG